MIFYSEMDTAQTATTSNQVYILHVNRHRKRGGGGGGGGSAPTF